MVVAITGASGAAYAQRLTQVVVDAGVEVHLVVSPLGQRLMHDELGVERVEPAALLSESTVQRIASGQVPGLVQHHYRDVGSLIASGSFDHDGMVIIPCSSHTLAAVANGLADNLLHRAAAVTLKERRPLVLVHREMPVSLVEIRNMQNVTEAGGIVCPASPGFYLMPRAIDDLVDFVVGRTLDVMGIEHGLNIRWDPGSGAGIERHAGHVEPPNVKET